MRPTHQRAVTLGAAALLMAGAIVAHAQEFRITLTDLTTGQPFSPPVFASHDATLSLWQLGDPASSGIRQIAESGNRNPLVADLTPLVGSSILGLVTPLSSPLLPGGSVSILIQADAAHPWLSSAWMLGRTNDTFSGETGIDLLGIGGTQTFDLVAYDAGTEVNTELATDVPALGGSGHVAENGVIHVSPGLRTIDHFVGGFGVDVNGVRTDIPADWKWDVNSPVARLTIQAVPEPGAWALLVGPGLAMAFVIRRGSFTLKQRA